MEYALASLTSLCRPPAPESCSPPRLPVLSAPCAQGQPVSDPTGGPAERPVEGSGSWAPAHGARGHRPVATCLPRPAPRRTTEAGTPVGPHTGAQGTTSDIGAAPGEPRGGPEAGRVSWSSGPDCFPCPGVPPVDSHPRTSPHPRLRADPMLGPQAEREDEQGLVLGSQAPKWLCRKTSVKVTVGKFGRTLISQAASAWRGTLCALAL